MLISLSKVTKEITSKSNITHRIPASIIHFVLVPFQSPKPTNCATTKTL